MTNPFCSLRLPIRYSFRGDHSQEIHVKTTSTDEIGELLKGAKTIAVVGLSDSPLRPSHGVSAYMQSQGYRVIPVNPSIKGALGEKAVPSLSDVGEKIDIVDVFRRSE